MAGYIYAAFVTIVMTIIAIDVYKAHAADIMEDFDND